MEAEIILLNIFYNIQIKWWAKWAWQLNGTIVLHKMIFLSVIEYLFGKEKLALKTPITTIF